MTTRTKPDPTTQQRLAVVKHLANRHSVAWVASATRLDEDIVREIGNEHGGVHNPPALLKAADVLARNLDREARSVITERPDLEAAERQQTRATQSKQASNGVAPQTADAPQMRSDKQANGKQLASNSETRNKKLVSSPSDDAHLTDARPDANLATDAKSTGHPNVDRHLGTGQPFDATAALLLRGRESSKKRTQALAQRISDQLSDLRDRLSDEDRERRAKVEEQRRRDRERVAREKEREEARAEVRRLEEQLRAAKAKARGHNKGYAGRKQRADAIKNATPRTATGEAGRSAASAYTDRLTALGVTAIQVREWAATAGHDCPARGMVPRRVLDAYEQAQTKAAS